MLVVDWLIFRHVVFPAVKSNPVENAPCDVTREFVSKETVAMMAQRGVSLKVA